MNLIQSVIATTLFEIKRSLSVQRILVTLVLAGFPPAMVTVIGLSGRLSGSRLPINDLLIILLVWIVSLLAQLLWATSNIYSELEGKSWIFLASRPRGRISLFLGKYLAAVTFSFLVCLISITLCQVIRTYLMTTMINPIQNWSGMVASALFGCLTYSAIFSLIGTLFQKRAMVFGAAYLILSEIIIANVPAIIANFTARFHLQSVAMSWIGWFSPFSPEEYVAIYGESSQAFHILCLSGAIIVLLTAGSFVVTTRQYITADET